MPITPGADAELREQYAQFLSEHEFTHYITQTFKRTRRDGSYVARQVGQMYEYYGASHSFIAVEPHKLDGIHLHSLVNFPEVPSPGLYIQSGKYGYYRTDVLAHETFTVSSYCAKYVVKGNEYHFIGDPGAWRTFRKPF